VIFLVKRSSPENVIKKHKFNKELRKTTIKKIVFNEKKHRAIDPFGVEWWFWNCKCPKCNNRYLRDPKKIGKVICTFDKTILVPIKCQWGTDGYIPKQNEFIQEIGDKK
jgi:hypothetical protein